jgi:hypothetical protein
MFSSAQRKGVPVSAGEAAYGEAGFGSVRLARLVGLMVITVGLISAAAIHWSSRR